MTRAFCLSCISILVAWSMPLFLNAQTYSWKQKSNFSGMERIGAFAFAIGQTGYIGGGFNINNLNDFWAYEQSTDSWVQKANLPVAVRFSNAFVLNGKGYFIGGLGNSGQINSMYEYNPITNNWTQRAPYPGVALYGAVSIAVSNKGYYGIGNGGSSIGPFYNDFYEYDPTLDIWTQKAPFPGMQRYGGIGINGLNKGYVGLGLTELQGGSIVLHNDWFEYDPTTNSWLGKTNFPGLGRSYPSAFNLNNNIYIGTGRTSNSSVESDFYKYNPISDTWNVEPNFISGPRWLAASFSINNTGYIGIGSDHYHSKSDFFEFSPDSLQGLTCLFQKPGAKAGKDAVILSGLPAYNSEPHPESIAIAWTCGGLPCIDRSLIQFDLSQIPLSGQIVSANLSLFADPIPLTASPSMYGTNNECIIQRILGPWGETTVTWNTAPALTTNNQVIVNQSTSAYQNHINIDVKNLVNDMLINGNHGFMIRLANEIQYNAKIFASSDHPNANYHPSLEVCYFISTGVNSEFPSPVETGFKLTYSPNPMEETLYLNFEHVPSQTNIVEIHDLQGKLVHSTKFTNNLSSFNLSLNLIELNPGIYIAKVYNQTDNVCFKFTKITR